MRIASSLSLLLASLALLPACMIVPIEPHRLARETGAAEAPALALAAPGPQLLQVRLYPVNAEAGSVGPLQAQVVDGLNGRGSFAIAHQGRQLSGEATRVGHEHPGFGALLAPTELRQAGRRGIANAAGSGLHVQCEYLLTGVGQGVGACLFSDGARYQMHFGR